MPITLPILFFVTAVFYAAVGFGGGSTYNALLVLNGTDYRILPAIALACNITVVTGGVWRFSRAGELPTRRMVPFLITSIPAAWLGGRLPVPEMVFIGLLGSALLLSGLRLALMGETKHQASDPAETIKTTSLPISAAVGGGIGLLSGIVGIGGGIFLAPVLYLMGWGKPRQIAGACSLFILANSLSGLLGQVMKLNDTEILSSALPYWPLLVCVLIGGQIGSWLGSIGLKPIYIKKLTAILILYVAVRLLWRWAGVVIF